MKDFAKKFYHSKKWQDCRNAYISERNKTDGGLCEECKEAPGYIVHHRVLLNEHNIDNTEITLNFKNLKFVCKNCHDKEEIHPFGNNKASRCVFTADGGVFQAPPQKNKN